MFEENVEKSEEDMSAEEKALENAIGLLTRASEVASSTDAMMGIGWALVAVAVRGFNSDVLVRSVADSAASFVNAPSPEAFAEMKLAVDGYLNNA